MPQFLEEELKREYGRQSAIPYKVMNSEGLMHGSKETAKGRALQKKHEDDQKKKPRGHGRASTNVTRKAR